MHMQERPRLCVGTAAEVPKNMIFMCWCDVSRFLFLGIGGDGRFRIRCDMIGVWLAVCVSRAADEMCSVPH